MNNSGNEFFFLGSKKLFHCLNMKVSKWKLIVFKKANKTKKRMFPSSFFEKINAVYLLSNTTAFLGAFILIFDARFTLAGLFYLVTTKAVAEV